LERLLVQLAEKPLDAFPQALPDWHQAKATYRFLANTRFGTAALVEGQRAATAATFAGQSLVYALHDTTTFTYTALKHTSGLGYIGDSETARGLHCHSTLAIRPDGVPIGLLHQHYWIRTELHTERSQSRPIEDKESYKWLLGVEATRTAVQALPQPQRPRILHIMDREGDIHEVFAQVLAQGDGAIIRRYRQRKVAEEGADADAAIQQAPLRGRVKLHLPASHGRKARTALVELRARPMTLAPNCKHAPGRRKLRLTMVEVREVSQPPEGEDALLWLLWTTEPATTKKQILAVVRSYALRWRIEDFHLVWKQGCRVEQLLLETRERLEKALVLYAGVAVRLLRLRELARQEPELPCTEVLTEEEWQALYAHATGTGAEEQTTVPTMAQAIQWLGRLGGHLGRKRDGLPGTRTLWRGWRDLAVLVGGFRAGRRIVNHGGQEQSHAESKPREQPRRGVTRAKKRGMGPSMA
jgi:hypothetical protein